MWETLVPFALFLVVMTGTPGPGNMTMLAIGQTTGFKSAVPFLAGSAVGFAALNLLVACGLGEAFKLWPALSQILRVLGAAYIIYLAVKILRIQAAPINAARRFSLFEGMLIHPLSPKSWAMSIAAYSQFMPPLHHTLSTPATITLFVLSFMVGQVSFHSLWCALGAGLYRLLKHPRPRLAVNGLLVTLMLVATGYALLV